MILGLSGKALSGKDTVADYLLDNYDWGRKTGFATNLKVACMEIFGLTEHQVFTQDGKSTPLDIPEVTTKWVIHDVIEWMKKTHNVSLNDKDWFPYLVGYELKTPRDILQFVGTEIMRYYVPDYHLEVVFRSIKSNENVIVTDVRFPNEAQAILNNGGKLVHIYRPDELRNVYGAQINLTHPSETALDDWNDWMYVLNNDGETLDSLYEKIDTMLEILKL